MPQATPLSRLIAATALAAAACAPLAAHADDAIPYPAAGSYNAVSYSFTAAVSGDLVAYFVDGGGAGYENQLGLLVNGVLSGAGYGLDNHASAVGDSFNFGHVEAGDTLVFVLHNLTVGRDAYSDPGMNLAYDSNTALVHNHVYATPYSATSPQYTGVPAGTYVAFEDIPFPGADYNYRDEVFVFSNVTVTAVPEPATALLMALGVVGLASLTRRRGPARPA